MSQVSIQFTFLCLIFVDYRLDEDHQKLSSYTFLHDEETAVISVYEVEKTEPYIMPEKFQVVLPPGNLL